MAAQRTRGRKRKQPHPQQNQLSFETDIADCWRSIGEAESLDTDTAIAKFLVSLYMHGSTSTKPQSEGQPDAVCSQCHGPLILYCLSCQLPRQTPTPVKSSLSPASPSKQTPAGRNGLSLPAGEASTSQASSASVSHAIPQSSSPSSPEEDSASMMFPAEEENESDMLPIDIKCEPLTHGETETVEKFSVLVSEETLELGDTQTKGEVTVERVFSATGQEQSVLNLSQEEDLSSETHQDIPRVIFATNPSQSETSSSVYNVQGATGTQKKVVASRSLQLEPRKKRTRRGTKRTIQKEKTHTVTETSQPSTSAASGKARSSVPTTAIEHLCIQKLLGLCERPLLPKEKNKAKCRAYRQAVKQDSVRYAEERQKNAERCRQNRRKPITDEERARINEAARFRVAKSRARKKAEKLAEKLFSTIIKEPCCIKVRERKDADVAAAQREKWAAAKRKERSQWTDQKWHSHREKTLRAYYERQRKRNGDDHLSDGSDNQTAEEQNSTSKNNSQSHGKGKTIELSGNYVESFLDVSKEVVETQTSLSEPFESAHTSTPSKDTRKTEDMHLCPDCGKVYGHKASMLRHRRGSHGFQGGPRYSCLSCDKKFHLDKDLQSHVNNVHLRMKPFKCDVCELSFSYERSRTRHVCRSREVSGYVCPKCGKLYPRRRNLQQHLYTHNDQPTFSCARCFSKFKHRSSLTKHEKQRCQMKGF